MKILELSPNILLLIRKILLLLEQNFLLPRKILPLYTNSLDAGKKMFSAPENLFTTQNLFSLRNLLLPQPNASSPVKILQLVGIFLHTSKDFGTLEISFSSLQDSSPLKNLYSSPEKLFSSIKYLPDPKVNSHHQKILEHPQKIISEIGKFYSTLRTFWALQKILS